MNPLHKLAVDARNDFMILAKSQPNQEMIIENFSHQLKVIYIPDIIDRYVWFCDNVEISQSYATILIEREAYEQNQ